MPKWKPAPPRLVAVFQGAIEALSDAESRKMFGYPSSFVNGQMFAGLFGESMFLRLSQDDRAEFMRIAGASLFEPVSGRPMREYMVVPQSILESEEHLKDWLTRAFNYALSLPPKEVKGRAKKKAR